VATSSYTYRKQHLDIMKVSISLALSFATLALGQAPTWYAFRPSTTAPSSLDLIDITDGAGVNTVIGTVALGAGEVAWPDAVRCLPGFCLVATSVAASGHGAEDESFVYKVNTANAAILYKVPAPGICAHMHVDFQTGHAYTLCVNGASALVVEVTGLTPITVVDISSSVARGRVAPGQTTHCSAFQSMYVGVDNGGAGNDLIVTVDLTNKVVSKTMKLSSPLPRALWATCDGSGVVGGVSFTPGASPAVNGTATFGAFDSSGAFKVDSTVAVFPGLEPSGLLTATSPATYQDAFLAAFYRPGTPANSTDATGALWAVDPYGGGSDDFVSPIDFYLIGAAWDREGR
jgi:hypothetical protein